MTAKALKTLDSLLDIMTDIVKALAKKIGFVMLAAACFASFFTLLLIALLQHWL